MISLGRGLVMFIMLMIFFTAIYTALPHRRLSICGQIPGAMFSAAGWALTSLAFSVYFRYFGNPWLLDAAAVVEKNENVMTDLSGLLEGKIDFPKL